MILYSFFIYILKYGFAIGAFFNKKIAKGKKGRAESKSKIQSEISPEDKIIWMHAASLGEYEQGLPVLEKLKENYPEYKVVISFFSPSGYEIIAKKNHVANVICYLPLDEKNEIKEFLNLFTPVIFFTVKYDYWYNLLDALKNKNCYVFAVATHFYPTQFFFKPYGKWFVSQLKKNVDFFFHQTERSLELSKLIGLDRGVVSGDTRFDRVRTFLYRNNEVQHIKSFSESKKLVVIGSAWQGEEEVLDILITSKQLKFIVAPHDLDRVPLLKNKYPSSILYSSITESADFSNINLLIIDSIGLLNKLYYYADIALVGGGFHSKGLHNILEAAVYGVPVFFGNKYKKNPEADDIIAFGGAKSASTPKQLAKKIETALYSGDVINMSIKAKQFVDKQPDSTKTIVLTIQKIVGK